MRRRGHPARQHVARAGEDRSGSHPTRKSAGFQSKRRAASCSTIFVLMPRPASDFISVGALTHSAKAADISMSIVAEPSVSMYDLSATGGSTCRTHLCRQAAFLFRNRIDQYRCAGSSTRWAHRTAQSYFADEQTAGRGRGDHSWHSAAGEGLYVSVLLRPDIVPASRLPIASARRGTRCRRGDSHGGRTECRPSLAQRSPHWRSQNRRHSGRVQDRSGTLPLSPSSASASMFTSASFDPDLATPATSLDIETGRTISRQALLVALLKSLEHETCASARSDRCCRNSRACCACFDVDLGRRVEVHGPQACTGVTAGLDATRVSTGAHRSMEL